MEDQFAEGWVTDGWSKVNGIWYELGGIPSIVVTSPEGSGPQKVPDITIHQVAEKLNELEDKLNWYTSRAIDRAKPHES